MSRSRVATVTDKFTMFIEYCIKHAHVLAHHIDFGDWVRDLHFEIRKTEEENDILREAVTWYADKSHWKDVQTSEDGDYTYPVAVEDSGLRARDAMARAYQIRPSVEDKLGNVLYDLSLKEL